MLYINLLDYNLLWREMPWIMKSNIFLISLFTGLAIFFFIAIIWIRLYKNVRNDKKKKQEILLIDFLNSILFDEDFDKELETEKFKKEYLNSSLEIKVTIKEIIHFHENLKGESAKDLENLFKNLGLVDFILKDLNKESWHTTARAINALSEMCITVPEHKIEAYLNEPRNEVRQQSQIYFLKMAKENPLDFLYKTVRPLTTWQQIYIENALKNFYKGTPPDFSQWLDHELLSVLEFSIRMIGRYNQFQHIEKLLPFIKHENEIIKKETIKCLISLEYLELLELIIPIFSESSRVIKLEILNAVKQLGSHEDLVRIGDQIEKTDWESRIKYLNIEQGFQPATKERIYSQFMLDKQFNI